MALAYIKSFFILIFVILLLILLGVGIIKFIEYLEDNPYGSKELIQKVVYTSVALHVLLFISGMQILQLAFSLSIQYTYNCMFDSYPFIRPEDPKFIYGLIASLVNYFLMIRFVSMNSIRLIFILPYFLIIWATPICFFFSMSATEDALFIKKGGKKTRTYVGLCLDWLFSLRHRINQRNE
ncbi:hypothetical protein GINT2_000371 [Glugoides intestinalis]